MFENHVSYISVASCNSNCAHLNTGQYFSSVKNGLSSTGDQVRLFKTVSEEQDYPFLVKKKNKVCICSAWQGVFLILSGLLKYCTNQPSSDVFAVLMPSLTWRNRLYFNHHLNLSATEAVMALPSPTDSIWVDSVDYLEVKRSDFTLLFSFLFALSWRQGKLKDSGALILQWVPHAYKHHYRH